MELQVQWLDTSAFTGEGIGIILRFGDENHFGLGEIHLAVDAAKATVLQLLTASAARLANMDLRNINEALDAVSSVTDQDSSAGPPVRAAFDTALHDLNGRLRGCAVHVLLGGSYRKEVALSRQFPNGARVSSRSGGGGDAVLLEYRREPARRTTSYGPGSATEWLTATIDRLGSSVQIDIDCQGRFDNPAQAKVLVEGLLANGPRLNIGLLQPLCDRDLIGHAALCVALPIPVILDSSVRSAKIMGQIIRLAAADRIVVSIERVGGLREAMKIVSIAEAASLGVSSASFARTAIGAAAAMHLASVLHSTLPARLDSLLADSGPIAQIGFSVREGVATIGDAPGLGVTLTDEALAAFQPVG